MWLGMDSFSFFAYEESLMSTPPEHGNRSAPTYQQRLFRKNRGDDVLSGHSLITGFPQEAAFCFQ
jgi:hypothetical protein